MSQSKFSCKVTEQNDILRNAFTNVIGKKEVPLRTFRSNIKFKNQCIWLGHARNIVFVETRPQDPHAGKDFDLHKSVQNRQSYKQEYIDPRSLSPFLNRKGYDGIILTSTNRIHTFNKWKYNKQYPKYLAEAGFYYRGDETFVHCFTCGKKTDVKKWLPEENPRQAHARINPDCKYVKENNFKPKVNKLGTNISTGTGDNVETVDREPLNKGKLETDGSPNQSDCVIPEWHTPIETAERNSHDAMNSQLVHPSLNGVKFKYEEFSDLKSRLLTFSTWNFESKQKANNLAIAGYFYTGENDIVRCFCCDLGLAEWDPRDDAWIEHARHSPSCWFLIHEKGDVFVQEIQKKWKQIYNPKHVEYDDKESRKRTFDGWREDISQTPEMLADAGFFFTGEEDIVRCHYCDGGLRNWEPGDDPWEEHTRWFPFCKFVIKMKGREYIENIRRQTTEQRELQQDVGNRNSEITDVPLKQIVDQLKELDISNDDINFAIDQFSKQTEETNLTVEWAMHTLYDSERKKTSPFSVYNAIKEDTLEKDPESIQQTNRELKEKLLCTRCKTNECCMVFVGCGHRVTCETCADKVDFCPYCNAKVSGRVKTYLS